MRAATPHVAVGEMHGGPRRWMAARLFANLRSTIATAGQPALAVPLHA